MNRHFVSFLLVFSFVAARGDDAVRSTQEELRRRNIYFGDIDGRQSAELQEALKHYQRRKGLPATGQEDHDTLRSLGVIGRGPNEPVPKELELPEEPVLKSDTRINVAAEAHEIAVNTGISAASVAPDAVASGRMRRSLRAGNANDEAGPTTKSGSINRSAKKSLNSQADLQGYVQDYLRAVGRNRLEDERPFYADRVNYLSNGTVDRRIIEHTLRKYYARWPHRSYSAGEIRSRAIPSRGEIVVTFRATFKLQNGGKKARGQTDNEIIINAATADPRIVSIKESRVRR